MNKQFIILQLIHVLNRLVSIKTLEIKGAICIFACNCGVLQKSIVLLFVSILVAFITGLQQV